MKKVIIFAALVLIFGALIFYFYYQDHRVTKTTVPSSTQVIHYTPSKPNNLPQESGSCWENSVAAPYRADAFRCMVENEISDPCFKIPDSQQLLCGEDQASASPKNSFLLSLTKSLPTATVPAPIPTNWAWQVQLSNGVTCTPFTGTLPFTATGEVAHYGCSDKSLIFGDINNAKALWTAKVGTLSTDPNIFPPVIVHSSTISIAKVWQ